MAKQPRSRKPNPRSEAADDAFIARILEISAWAKENARLVSVIAVVLVLGAAASLYYVNYQDSLRERAVVQLSQARQTVASGNTALAIRDLETFVSQFGGTPAGKEGRVLLGQLYLQEGQPGKAVETLQPLAADPARPLGAPAAFLLGAAYEASEQWGQAEETYLRIADQAAFSFQQREALADAARLRMQQGDPAGAAELYDRILALVPEDNPQRTVYEMRLAEARAAAQTGTTSQGG